MTRRIKDTTISPESQQLRAVGNRFHRRLRSAFWLALLSILLVFIAAYAQSHQGQVDTSDIVEVR